ncbi:MAG: DUF2344 domain-containing protein [Atopobiaceae bacterium]|nr:DUF2344 domain-containing protein [Atopobiaceae bacterium]
MMDKQFKIEAPEIVKSIKKDWRTGRPQIQPEIMTERGTETFRLRVAYKKDNRLAFLGHLELITTIDRCVRRAQLPFRVGNGFAKRMSIQFSQSLPTGASSDAEYYDLKLTEYVEPDEALERLKKATPPALAPFAVAYVDRSLPALEVWLNASRWKCSILGKNLSAEILCWSFDELLARGEITYMRGEKKKVVDLKSTFVRYSILDEATSHSIMFELDTLQAKSASLRPGILLRAAQECAHKGNKTGLEEVDSMKVCRISQVHVDLDGRLVNPL